MVHLNYVTPEDIGIDAKRLLVAHRVIQRDLDRGLYPGAVYIVGRRNGALEPECFGGCDPDGARPVCADTIYDLASLTKPIATAASLLKLIELGEVHLGQQIAHFFPGRDLKHIEGVTLRHLLTHTSGLPAWKDLHSDGQGKEEIVASILSTPLDNAPGAVYTYSCMGYILLGVIIESIAGCGLDEFSRENCFLPLGMEDTTFGPCGDVLHRTAATSNCPARKRTLVGEVHDGNAWAMGGVSGNAGLFSTAPDLAKFATMMLNGGLGALSPAAVRLAMASMLPPTIGGHTAGWFAYPNDMLPSGDLLSVEAIGHTGFTGTSAVIDPSCDLFVILLTNRVCSAADASEFSKTRRLFHNAVAQAMHSGR